MELKVGKDKSGDEITYEYMDISKANEDISKARKEIFVLEEAYKRAKSDKDMRDIGEEISYINNKIEKIRNDLREHAFGSVTNAQMLESEVSTLSGKLYKYRDISESIIAGVVKEFNGDYHEMYVERDDVLDKLRYATGEEKSILQDIADVLDAAIVIEEISSRKEAIRSLLPKGFDSAEEVSNYGNVFGDEERRAWFDNGDIKSEHIEDIKHGKTFVKDGIKVHTPGVIDSNIKKYTDSIKSVDGVRPAITREGTRLGKGISFSEEELNNLANVDTPEDMIDAINDRCTFDQRNAFAIALGSIDEDGNILENAGVVCNVPESEIYSAFNRMHELEKGVEGSGYEYMQMFLKNIFKYGAFSDTVYDEMANCSNVDDLLAIIEEELLRCPCPTKDVKKERVIEAFYNKEILGGLDPKSKNAYMNKALREIFVCNTFDDHVYNELADYEDSHELVDRINKELSDAGVYDESVLNYAIEGIDESSVLNKDTAAKQLDDVFGDHFTKRDYEDASSHIMSSDSLVDGNREALINRFRTIAKEGQILSGKILEGISNDDYNEMWDKERQKMINHGETKNIDAIIKQRQVEAAQKYFANIVAGISDESIKSREELLYIFESLELKPYVVRNLASSIVDIEYAIDDNIKRLHRNMRDLIKKGKMYEEDIFNETKIYDAVEKRGKLDMGDSKAALEHMKASISSAVGGLDMGGYAESLIKSTSDRITNEYEDIGDIADEFDRMKDKIVSYANERIRDVSADAIVDLYEGKSFERKVHIPPYVSRREMQSEHIKERKEVVASVSAGIHGRIAPFMSAAEIDDYTDAIPKRPAKPRTAREKAELKWWESYMSKINPVIERTEAFNDAGLALVKRTGVGNPYIVYGEGGKSAGFKNLKELDKWFKTNYGKR